jgi:hypothetical protein
MRATMRDGFTNWVKRRTDEANRLPGGTGSQPPDGWERIGGTGPKDSFGYVRGQSTPPSARIINAPADVRRMERDHDLQLLNQVKELSAQGMGMVNKLEPQPELYDPKRPRPLAAIFGVFSRIDRLVSELERSMTNPLSSQMPSTPPPSTN